MVKTDLEVQFNLTRDVVSKFINSLMEEHITNEDALCKVVRSIVEWHNRNLSSTECLKICKAEIKSEAILQYFDSLFNAKDYDMEMAVSRLDFLKRACEPPDSFCDPPFESSYFPVRSVDNHASTTFSSAMGYKVINCSYMLVGNSPSTNNTGFKTRNKSQSSQSQRDALELVEDEMIKLSTLRESAMWFIAMLSKHENAMSRLSSDELQRYRLTTYRDEQCEDPDITGCHTTILQEAYGDKQRSTQICRLLVVRPAEYISTVKATVLDYAHRLSKSLNEQRDKYRIALQRVDRNCAMRQKPGKNGVTMVSFSGRALLCAMNQLKSPAIVFCVDNTSTTWFIGCNDICLDIDKVPTKKNSYAAFYHTWQMVSTAVEKTSPSDFKSASSKLYVIANTLLRTILCQNKDYHSHGDTKETRASTEEVNKDSKSCPIVNTIFVADDVWYILIRMFTQLYRTNLSLIMLSDADIERLRLNNVYDQTKINPYYSMPVPEQADQCMQLLLVSCVRVSIGEIVKDVYDSLVTAMYGRKSIDLLELPEFVWTCGKQLLKVLGSPESLFLFDEYVRHQPVNGSDVFEDVDQTEVNEQAKNVKDPLLHLPNPLQEYTKNVLIARKDARRRYIIYRTTEKFQLQKILFRFAYTNDLKRMATIDIEPLVGTKKVKRRRRCRKRW